MRDIEQYEIDYQDNSFESALLKFRHRKTAEILNGFQPRRILEVGCGLRPIYSFYTAFDELLIVEASRQFASAAEASAPENVRVINQALDASLAESVPFDSIVISSLLHELEDPAALLTAARSFADENTVFHINVPNANSVHRLLALRMGLIGTTTEISARQRRFQQHFCFDTNSLTALLVDAGLELLSMETFFIKPLTHEQMQALLDSNLFDDQLLEGLYRLSEDLPDMGAEIAANARFASRRHSSG